MTFVTRLVPTQMEGTYVAAIPDIFYTQTDKHVQVNTNRDVYVKKCDRMGYTQCVYLWLSK